MKQLSNTKQKKDDLITKKYLDEKLDVTKKYLDGQLDKTKKSLREYFDVKLNATTEYLLIKIEEGDNKLDKKIDRVIHYMNLKFDAVEERLKKLDTIDERLDKILTTLDWLVNQYEKFEQEYTVASEQSRRIEEELDNHEKRISTLEQRTAS